MRSSLRARLALTTLGVAGAALLAVAGLSRLAVRSASERLLAVRAGAGLAGVAPLLAEVPDGELDGRLASVARSLGVRLLLLAPDGKVLAASAPGLREARVRLDGERLEVEEREARAGQVVARRTVLLGAPAIQVQGRGTLHPLPDEDTIPPAPLAGLDRSLLLAALLAGVFALGLALVLARRIVGPIEALTDAARRMGAGDLAVRVAVGGRDEIAELGVAFNAMADARARAEALRQALVTDVAHELRTPLTNLRCHLEAIQDGLQPADGATVRSLHEETLILSRLVDDLQDLALAEAGRLLLRRESLSLAEVVEAAVAGLLPRAAAGQVVLEVAVAPDLAVEGDRDRLGQVLRNLLANAIAHTPPGGRVTVGVERRSPSVELSVTDTGSGIAPDHLPLVFERFYRADPARARASGGAGLGLAIVQKLVQAHGGSVRAWSEPGRGSRFTVVLPEP